MPEVLCLRSNKNC